MTDEILLTTPEVAERLGVSIRRVQALIHEGRLPSQQFGRDHLIRESDLVLVANRKPGRPTKQDEGEAQVEASGGEATSVKPTEKRSAKKTEAKKARKKGSGQ
jgi:excisionase family DNA binding protein